MSHEAVQWVLEHSEASGTDKVLLLSIAHHMNKDSDKAWPSVATLARHSGVSERGVQKALRRLAGAGQLVIEEKSGGQRDGRYRTNNYLFPGFRGVPQFTSAEVSPSSPLEDSEVSPRTVRGELQGHSEVSPRTPEQEENHQEQELPLVGSSEPVNLADARRERIEREFAEFWSLYPRSDARHAALKSWNRLTQKQRDAATDAVGRYAGLVKRDRVEKRFIPHGSTWLNQRRWEDVPDEMQAASNGRVFDADTGAWLSASAVERMR